MWLVTQKKPMVERLKNVHKNCRTKNNLTECCNRHMKKIYISYTHTLHTLPEAAPAQHMHLHLHCTCTRHARALAHALAHAQQHNSQQPCTGNISGKRQDAAMNKKHLHN